MRIRFETTIDDIIAFNRFHCEYSPMWRRQRLVFASLGPVIVAIGAIAILVRTAADFGVNQLLLVVAAIAVVFVGISALLCYSLAGWMLLRNTEAATRKMLAEGSNRSVLGWREMELMKGRLHTKTELIETWLDLQAIEKISANDRYTFVYIASFQAFIIPMNLYPEEEYRAFIAELRDAWENQPNAPAPADARPLAAPDERISENPV